MSLDIVTMQMCESINGPITKQVGAHTVSGLFHERFYPYCTCAAYKFGKRTVRFGSEMKPEICKHIRQAEHEVCGWHEQYSATRQTEKENENQICPECGGTTTYVQVAI